ncbi:MAG: hypothetical protein ACQSGP_22460, partial [Frankia sp.]
MARRRSGVLAGAAAAGLAAVGDTAVRRARRAGLDVIGTAAFGDGPADDRPADDGPADNRPADDRTADYGFLLAAGVTLTDGQRRAAAAYARREGLDVLDLVPADLPARRLRGLLRR